MYPPVTQFIHGDQALATWNLVSRCSVHVAAALTAAVEIRDHFIASSTRLPAGLDLTCGVWTGRVLSGSLGTAELRSFGTLGCQLSRAVALQQYAATVSRRIVVNAGVWQATREAPQHRLLPIDVVDLSEVNPVKGQGEPEIVYECLATLAPAEDEWMYQLMDVHAENQVHRDGHPTMAPF